MPSLSSHFPVSHQSFLLAKPTGSQLQGNLGNVVPWEKMSQEVKLEYMLLSRYVCSAQDGLTLSYHLSECVWPRLECVQAAYWGHLWPPICRLTSPYSLRALTMESTHHKAKEERFAAVHTIPGTLSLLLELSIPGHSGKAYALEEALISELMHFINISKVMFKNNLGISFQSPPQTAPDNPRQSLSSHLPSPATPRVY